MTTEKSATGRAWLWCPASGDALSSFLHPSDVPTTDEAAATACFVNNARGPRHARISPITAQKTDWGDGTGFIRITERGAASEVPKHMVLPWYEGLLLLEELETAPSLGGHAQAAWCDDELRAVLEEGRISCNHGGQLNSSDYVERHLWTTAITCSQFVDSEDCVWRYRRKNLREKDKRSKQEGEDGGEYYRISAITAYLPPWEAFCHDKCGVYQDFYLVHWAENGDYTQVENGATGAASATWEPDECLPAHLDPLRLAAKRTWKKERKELEKRRIGTPSKEHCAWVLRSRTDEAVVRSVEIGVKVRRGPDWVYGNQNGGADATGHTIKGADVAGWVCVRWKDDTTDNVYRVGADGKHDLATAQKRVPPEQVPQKRKPKATLGRPRVRACAKMLVSSGLRCSCHFQRKCPRSGRPRLDLD